MARIDYSTYLKKEGSNSNENKDFAVTFFSLKEDGDEAIVRFNYDTVEQFHIVTVHALGAENKFRRISCLRTGLEPLSHCPLCEKGDKVFDKMYVKLIEYTTDATGKVTAQAKVWERAASFSKELFSNFQEYGPLSDVVFKIKRRGARGDMKTTYDILFANPHVYKPEVYTKDFSAFDDYDLTKVHYLKKSFEEMQQFVRTGSFPEVSTTTAQTTAQPQSVASTSATVQHTTPQTQQVNTAPVVDVVATSPAVQQAQDLASTDVTDPTLSSQSNTNIREVVL